jgi:uncharacterized protein
MARSLAVRLMAAALLVAAELAAVSAVLVVAPAPAEAQFLFGDRFPFFGFGRSNNNRRGGGWFGLPQQQDNSQYVDYSRAPAPTPRKPDAPPVQTPILVLGDSMADWLGYGLEQAFSDTPEIGILRRQRTLSGLIRADVRSDPRGDYPDWPQAAREMIASQKPKFVVMMIGLNDRRSIREAVQATRAKPAQPADNDPASRELDEPVAKPAAPETAAAPDATPPGATKTYEFRSDAWSEAYIRRIDETIAALKTSGVPIFWVGLPPIRSGRNAGDIPFLNELYRSRADKAGIVYVDVWDGFVDEDGRFAQSGPDFEGQTRRLRSGDGVYFTQPGARKLAHFVEREIDRWLSARAVAVAVPAEEPKAAAPAPADIAPAAAPGKNGPSKARPLAGPALPLISEPADDSGELLGGSGGKSRPAPASPSAVADAVAAKVLVKGETMPVPAGRADDFSWPRRNVAPVGADPAVATTDLPMTPMVAERTTAPAKPADDPAAAQAAAAKPQQQATQRVRSAGYQTQYRPSFFGGGRGGGMNFFPFLFGGGR